MGTHTAGFDRLVRALDSWAEHTDERVVIQIGCSAYVPQFSEWFRMTTSEKMAAYMQMADLIVTHAADTLLEAVMQRKRVVAVPRQSRFGEHIDDHQVDLGRKLMTTIGLAVVENIDDLPGALSRSREVDAVIGRGDAGRLVAALRASIDDLR